MNGKKYLILKGESAEEFIRKADENYREVQGKTKAESN